MTKKTKSKVCVQCRCSRCGQIASAQEGTVHHYCHGIDAHIWAQLPPSLKGLTNPTRKGSWKAFVEPVKVETDATKVA